MKISTRVLIVILFFAALFLSISFYKVNLSHAQVSTTNSACLAITGKFTAVNWSGGTVMVGCDGDAGPNCPGQLKTVAPGQTYTLTKCSCPPYADGCLKVAKQLKLVKNSAGRPRTQVVGQRFPTSCSISNIKNTCGSNGQQITGNFKISCNVPSPTPAPSQTPTPFPSGSVCPKPAPVTNVKITCPDCTLTVTPTPVRLD